MKTEIRHATFSDTFALWKSRIEKKWSPEAPSRTIIFEDKGDYWNAMASVFLHYHWEKAFRKYSTFRNKVADPLMSETNEVIRSLSRHMPDRFMDNDAPAMQTEILRMIKPRMRWPWTYRFVDIMGTVGINPIASEYIVALGLVQPMEHLAFLTSLSESPISLMVLADGTISLPQDGDMSKGNVAIFQFRLPDSVENPQRVEELRDALQNKPEKVSIFAPSLYSGWEAMRESYDEQTLWIPKEMRGLVFSYDAEASLEQRRFGFSKIRKELSEEIRWNRTFAEENKSFVSASVS